MSLPTAEIVAVPARFCATGIAGHLDRFGPDIMDGWITNEADPSPPVAIDIVEHGTVIATITANTTDFSKPLSKSEKGKFARIELMNDS